MRELLPYNAIATRHQEWYDLKNGIAANETDLAAAGRDFASLVIAGVKRLGDDINFAELAVILSTNVTAATIVIYAARKGGPAEKVCSIDVAPGSQVVGFNPVTGVADARLYADAMTVTGVWYDDIKTADAAGADGVAKAIFDLVGRQYLLAMITSITVEGEDDPSVDVIFSGF